MRRPAVWMKVWFVRHAMGISGQSLVLVSHRSLVVLSVIWTSLGIKHVVELLTEHADKYGERFKPCQSLLDMAEAGQSLLF